MAALLDLVRQFARQHELFHPETRIVAAVSGGSDSVALAHILRELHLAGRLTLVGVAHLNHRLRDGAERDERLAVAVADSLDVPAFVERADVRSRVARERRSLEDAAHAERYEFFERARERAGADRVAVGHTRDDQAETFLLRLLRGAGTRGLAGMYPRHGPVIRPLLECRRSDLRRYLDDRRLAYADDESNEDVTIVRNRVRAELLPLLRDRFNPAIVDVLADEAAIARETWHWVSQAANEVYVRVMSTAPGPGACRYLDLAGLHGVPPVLRRLVVWRAMSEVAADRPISFAHVEAALRLIDAHRDAQMDAPGQRVQRNGLQLVLTGRPPDAVGRPMAREADFHYLLSIPGEVRLAESGWVVSIEPLQRQPAAPETGASVGNGPVAFVRRDLFNGPLGVRNRRPGDRFRPAGLPGNKKLQDYFVDRKVARSRRDHVPLVVDETDRIVWVAGHVIDEAFRVTDPAQGVLILKLRQV